MKWMLRSTSRTFAGSPKFWIGSFTRASLSSSLTINEPSRKRMFLYGVTMEEHGISKLVGVKLTQRENSTETSDLIGTDRSTASIAESFGKHGNLHSEMEQ